jgi:2,3-diaminopropionate biosynthesis protein SbnB
MLYLNQADLEQLGVDWSEQVRNIERAVECMAERDYVQPIKPYLRYKDPRNRIIAMPAYLGGSYHIAGIKWIASFPGNIEQSIPRAHSVVILNDADTGRPLSIIHTALLSIVRTASVSGLILQKYDQVRQLRNVKVGIVGLGPIGQYHLRMCAALLGERISEIALYDIKGIHSDEIPPDIREKVRIADSWQDAYDNADVFITCTVSKAPYVDRKPKIGSLQLNVSLRDFTTDVFEYVKGGIVVDDWEEVCREKTDIEMLHIEKGLQKEDTLSIVDVAIGRALESLPADQTVMFNPMGMAIFDMSIGALYYRQALEQQAGQQLD